jgi:hypothetical protein
MKITLNQIQCNHCQDIITSEYRHDFKWCKCGRVAVDGGKDYLKRCFEKADGENGGGDNSLKNVYWATPSQNSGADRRRDGTDNRGEKSGMAKLNQMQVRIIKRLRGVVSQVDAAQIFKVHYTTISNVQTGKSWGWH